MSSCCPVYGNVGGRDLAMNTFAAKAGTVCKLCVSDLVVSNSISGPTGCVAITTNADIGSATTVNCDENLFTNGISNLVMQTTGAGDTLTVGLLPGTCDHTILQYPPNGGAWQIIDPPSDTVVTAGGTGMYPTVAAALTASPCKPYVRVVGDITEPDAAISAALPAITPSTAIIYVDPGRIWTVNNANTIDLGGKSLVLRGAGEDSRIVFNGTLPQFQPIFGTTIGPTTTFTTNQIRITTNGPIVHPTVITRVSNTRFSLLQTRADTNAGPFGLNNTTRIVDTQVTDSIIENTGVFLPTNVFVGENTIPGPGAGNKLVVHGYRLIGNFGNPTIDVMAGNVIFQDGTIFSTATIQVAGSANGQAVFRGFAKMDSPSGAVDFIFGTNTLVSDIEGTTLTTQQGVPVNNLQIVNGSFTGLVAIGNSAGGDNRTTGVLINNLKTLGSFVVGFSAPSAGLSCIQNSLFSNISVGANMNINNVVGIGYAATSFTNIYVGGALGVANPSAIPQANQVVAQMSNIWVNNIGTFGDQSLANQSTGIRMCNYNSQSNLTIVSSTGDWCNVETETAGTNLQNNSNFNFTNLVTQTFTVTNCSNSGFQAITCGACNTNNLQLCNFSGLFATNTVNFNGLAQCIINDVYLNNNPANITFSNSTRCVISNVVCQLQNIAVSGVTLSSFNNLSATMFGNAPGTPALFVNSTSSNNNFNNCNFIFQPGSPSPPVGSTIVQINGPLNSFNNIQVSNSNLRFVFTATAVDCNISNSTIGTSVGGAGTISTAGIAAGKEPIVTGCLTEAAIVGVVRLGNNLIT